MKLILCAVDRRLDEAWHKACDGLDSVSFHFGSILDTGADAVVSPANSFGFMDGGLDALYLKHFPGDIQMRVRRQIFDRHAGELPVGTAGTGVGGISPDTSARQVRAAIDEILLRGYRMPQSWAEASERHQLLYTDRPARLQY